jgi:hypothetical protein
MMDHARKPGLFAVFVFALIVLLYAAVAPLGHARETLQTTQTILVMAARSA